jgi:hypothetical protein
MEEYGVSIIEQETTGEVPVMAVTYDAKASCKWVLTRGRRFGETCDKKCLIETDYCRDHQKGQVSTDVPEDVTDELVDVTDIDYSDDCLNNFSEAELLALLSELDKRSITDHKEIEALPVPEYEKDVSHTELCTIPDVIKPDKTEPVVVIVQLGEKKVTITIE